MSVFLVRQFYNKFTNKITTYFSSTGEDEQRTYFCQCPSLLTHCIQFVPQKITKTVLQRECTSVQRLKKNVNLKTQWNRTPNPLMTTQILKIISYIEGKCLLT